MTMSVGYQARIHAALGHPIRLDLYRLLCTQTASPSDLAPTLGRPLGVVAYHARILRDAGLIIQVREQPRRGAVEHYYRATQPTFKLVLS